MSTDSQAELVYAYRQVMVERLSLGTSGNLSTRTSTGMLITPSGVEPDAMEPDDLCEMSAAGELLAGGRPSSEWQAHRAIYAVSDDDAIVHTHAAMSTAVSTVVDELPAVHYMITRLGGPVPVAPYATFGTEELAASVAHELAGRRAVICRNHGAFVTGATLHDALANARLLEWLCEVYWRASSLGSPHILSADDLAAMLEQARRLRYEGADRG